MGQALLSKHDSTSLVLITDLLQLGPDGGTIAPHVLKTVGTVIPIDAAGVLGESASALYGPIFSTCDTRGLLNLGEDSLVTTVRDAGGPAISALLAEWVVWSAERREGGLDTMEYAFLAPLMADCRSGNCTHLAKILGAQSFPGPD